MAKRLTINPDLVAEILTTHGAVTHMEFKAFPSMSTAEAVSTEGPAAVGQVIYDFTQVTGLTNKGYISIALYDKNNAKVAELSGAPDMGVVATDPVGKRRRICLKLDATTPAGQASATSEEICYNIDENQFSTGKFVLMLSGKQSTTTGPTSRPCRISAALRNVEGEPLGSYSVIPAGNGVTEIVLPFAVTVE